ncbi:MAG: uncharacterized protein KVP18_000713 [Porospora cf. gigantea A]|uniref:uncharacterized protein n=1 Tax=Porospora cf. gigantea A TaxID=2853593 RepID=UPI003559AD01|nr:MAG: hypothetical protein KVP18_000713 [Porospora cf. gigantea A]
MWWWWPLLARLLVASRWRDAVWDAVSLCESEPSTLNLTVDDTEERLMHLIRLSKAPMHLPVVHLLQHWELFGKKDRLLESDDIKAQRLDVFKANQDIIHQSKGSPYTLGETIFMDMLAHEVKRMFPAKNKRSHHDSGVGAPVALDRNAGETTALPPALDWSLTGCVGPVTNQGNCGACYALASTSSHESSLCLRNLRRLAKDLDDRPGETVEQRFVRAEKRSAMVDVWAFRDLGTPVSPFHSASVPEQPYSQSEHLTLLSAQQTVDCSSEYGNSGCAGGDFRPAFEYLMKRPLCLDQDYSYAEADSPCLASSCVKSNWRRWMMTDFGVCALKVDDTGRCRR